MITIKVAWNFFHISDHLTIEGNGQVSLTDEELAKLNRLIKEAGFEEQLEAISLILHLLSLLGRSLQLLDDRRYGKSSKQQLDLVHL